MPYDRLKHHRRSIRIQGYDYARAVLYFVTIVTHDRELLFGDVVNGVMELNESGRAVAACWADIPLHCPGVALDEFIVMPNHFHGIMVINNDTGADTDRRGTACRAPATTVDAYERFGKPRPGSLATVVRSFKSAATKQINAIRDTHGAPVWQRNYYEHIIRNQDELERVRAYIADNPARWTTDEENPQNAGRGTAFPQSNRDG